MQGQAQGRHKKHDQLADLPTSPLNAFLEVDTEVEAHLPPRDTNVMVSHSSIYLNSQQIAKEAEEMERERGINMDNEGWDGLRETEEGWRREWDEDQESEDKKDNCDGNICIELLEVENTQSCSDQVADSFSHDCD
uniref:PPUP7751 n=1 Tax=Poeciliopsis prolifica TaxID=188132 RepID=A0A0S7EMG8_9TELE